MWHGAAITFIIWGAIHGIIIVFEKVMGNHRLAVNSTSFIGATIFTTLTFVIVCFAWIFFRANSFSDSIYIVNNLFDFSCLKNVFMLGLPEHEFKLAIIAILALLGFDFIHRKFNALKLLNKTHFIVRSLVYVTIIYVIIIFGVYGDGGVAEFIYFQF